MIKQTTESNGNILHQYDQIKVFTTASGDFNAAPLGT